MWNLKFISFLLCFGGDALAYSTILKQEIDANGAETEVVEAVAGGDTLLPCKSLSPRQNDSLLLVVWYRDDTPIYSYDNRLHGPQAHWSELESHDGHEALGQRALWQMDTSGLHLRHVKPGDAGTYHCRVDFKISPTKNFRVDLEVTVLPDKPRIFNEFGVEVAGTAGPYHEGGSFQLTCMVTGGKPSPRVRWLRDDKILAENTDTNDISEPKTLRLNVKNLTRAHLNAVYTCAAENTPLALPVKATVQIDLYLRPLSVEILDKDQPLSAGRLAKITCRSGGARPAAEISWWLDGRLLLNSNTTQNQENGNVSLSVLTWSPSLEDNGKILACKSHHKSFNHSSIEARLPLNIQFVPIVNVQYGSKLNPSDIEEGDDVYFECKVRANPPAYKVLWEHNGVVMQHNQRAGVIAASDHLALQEVTRKQTGKYTCTASNVEGDGRSPPLNLQVMYKPVCRPNTQGVYGVALQEKAQVVCLVDAHPPPDSFIWMLNNSVKSIEVDKSRYTVEASAGRSVLTYSPTSDLDYGTLSCRAANLAGQQPEPCLFNILPTAKPDPPKNCTVQNITDKELSVKCDPGYDGGLKTTFNLEIWSGDLMATNISVSKPTWIVDNLPAGTEFRMMIYASNSRGRAKPVSLQAMTKERTEPRTEAQAAWEVTWAVGGVVGAAVTIGVILCLALFATRLKRRARDYDVSIQAVKGHKSSPTTPRASPLGPDDKNPDVVPLNKGTYSPLANQPIEPTSGTREPPPYCPAPPPPLRPPRSAASSHSLHVASAPPHPALENEFASLTCGRITRREIVTTRTPLLSSVHQESCV